MAKILLLLTMFFKFVKEKITDLKNFKFDMKNWKKYVFWAVVLVVFIGAGLYLKYAGFGAALMALLFFAGGCLLGWLGKMFYDKFIKPVVGDKETVPSDSGKEN